MTTDKYHQVHYLFLFQAKFVLMGKNCFARAKINRNVRKIYAIHQNHNRIVLFNYWANSIKKKHSIFGIQMEVSWGCLDGIAFSSTNTSWVENPIYSNSRLDWRKKIKTHFPRIQTTFNNTKLENRLADTPKIRI